MSLLYVTPLLALLAGSIAYCMLTVIGAVRYRHSGTAQLRNLPPVSVLRPLAGVELNTESKLRSVFEQEYPHFEVLLAVHEESDPATGIARRVMADFPHVFSRLIIAGPSPFPRREDPEFARQNHSALKAKPVLPG